MATQPALPSSPTRWVGESWPLLYIPIYFIRVSLWEIGCLLIYFFKALECCVRFCTAQPPVGPSKHSGEFSGWERGSRRSSACQLWWTFLRNKYPLRFPTILSGVDWLSCLSENHRLSSPHSSIPGSTGWPSSVGLNCLPSGDNI